MTSPLACSRAAWASAYGTFIRSRTRSTLLRSTLTGCPRFLWRCRCVYHVLYSLANNLATVRGKKKRNLLFFSYGASPLYLRHTLPTHKRHRRPDGLQRVSL